MSVNAYMWIGFFCALVGCVMLATSHDVGGWLMFGGGMLFGKGYGVWEERESRQSKDETR